MRFEVENPQQLAPIRVLFRLLRSWRLVTI